MQIAYHTNRALSYSEAMRLSPIEREMIKEVVDDARAPKGAATDAAKAQISKQVFQQKK